MRPTIFAKMGIQEQEKNPIGTIAVEQALIFNIVERISVKLVTFRSGNLYI